jgi:hypothetical protein
MMRKLTSAEAALGGCGEVCETSGGPQRMAEKSKAKACPRTLEHIIWTNPTRPVNHKSAVILRLVDVRRHIAKMLTKNASGKTLGRQSDGLIDVVSEKCSSE